jgi:hypothetical protein
MMPIEPGALVVVLLYAGCLAIILFVSPKLGTRSAASLPWWKRVRLWAALVALVQLLVYAVWG